MDGRLWRSILDKVQPHLPSIDSTSSSEDESFIEIFQRPSGLSLQLIDDGDETISQGKNNTVTEEPLDVIEPEKSAELNKSPDTALDSNEWSTKCSYNNDIVLSFPRLEDLDLNVFQNTKKDEAIKQHASTCLELADGYTDDKEDHYKAIMEKIESFCKKTINSPQVPDYVKEDNMGKVPEENMVEEIKEHPTIYIDLRHSTQTFTKPVNKEAMPENRQVNMGTQTNYRNETGKSMLLWKIRENSQRNKGMNTKSVNEKRELVSGKPLESGETILKYNFDNQLELLKPETQSQKNNQGLSKKQRDHHLKYQYTVKELEKGRPTKSVLQKQPAAENTDLLCDIEASYLGPVPTIPTDIGNDGNMLLIVSLSSPGMISERGHRKRRKIDAALIKPQIYNTIVTWLLSLVGPKSSNSLEADANVPFWVVGLQQLWTENGLALYALAAPKQTYTQRIKKKDSSIHNPFYNHIQRFLSETSFHTIAHWLPQLNAMMGKDTYNAPICLPLCCLSSFITATCNKKVISRIFDLSPGFYWQTLETPGHECKGRETIQELHTEVSITLGHKDFYHDPLVTHFTLQAILESGLDICGLRLLYPSPEPLPDHFGFKSLLQKCDDTCVLAVAVRGPFAHSLLHGITRTVQNMNRQKTVVAENVEEDSLLLFTPQQRHEVHKELCLCFSGRLVKESGKYQEESLKSKVQGQQEDASLLCATTKADIVLVVSPLIPHCCYGQVLSTCERRGFIIRGLQIMEIDHERASLLGLSSQQAQIFCTATSQKCLVLILKKENALYHSISLPAALVKEFKTHNLLTFLQSRGDDQTVETCLCFHSAPYSNNMYYIFAQSAWVVPNPCTVVLSNQKCLLDLEPDDVAVLTLCGQDMSQGLGLLHRALTQHGFELLGLKWLHALRRLQALEVSPYEVGERFSRSALVTLMSAPALVCALRQKNALSVLRKLLPRNSSVNLDILMSPTPQMATRLCALFFFEHEIISCAVEK